ncbi:hypothetical protein RJ639_022289 [Escallonia herrerae]|uniref:Protein kinase domain-containing protein n=1 Tax=Escallonia herrerae TaxID=1293975 RepID=A0AA88V2F0_9ASTE|nr:hypothetical protein RJ639_022289 [Escallonia herrerae]
MAIQLSYDSDQNQANALRRFLEGHQGMLVCDLASNGRLYDHPFGAVVKRPSWPIRRKIALGMACGLAYLHYGAQLIKASNVLLDENFEPNKFWPCKVWSKGDDTSEHKVSSYGVVLLSGRKALLSKDKEKACLLTERAWS